jgi:hypothetical protein
MGRRRRERPVPVRSNIDTDGYLDLGVLAMRRMRVRLGIDGPMLRVDMTRTADGEVDVTVGDGPEAQTFTFRVPG